MKDGRYHLYLRMPEALKQEIQTYAKSRHTTVSALVLRFFTNLLEEERRNSETVDAEQV
jgi:hypothetical protein